MNPLSKIVQSIKRRWSIWKEELAKERQEREIRLAKEKQERENRQAKERQELESRLARERRELESRLAKERQEHEYWQWHESLYPGGSSQSYEWQQLRLQVVRRDHYRCVQCGREGRFPRRYRGQPFKPTGPYVGLHVHHIRPLNQGGTNYPSNLETLCKNCHETVHGRQLKGASLEFDYIRGYKR